MFQAILKVTLFIKYLCVSIAFLVFFSCKQQKQTETFSNQLHEKLEVCSKRKSVDGHLDGFKGFFADWNKTIEQNKIEIIHQNEIVNTIFEVYKIIYKPFELSRLGTWEGENDLNLNCQYAVVQNKIFYSILSTDNLDDYDWEKSEKIQ